MYTTDMYEGMVAETVTLNGHGGDPVYAYLARPIGAGPFPGVVLIHHLPGWDEWYREATRRFAHHGYAAISPNLYHREGHGDPDDVGATVRAAGGVADDQVVGDVAAAMGFLRSAVYCTGKVGVIGSCSGGRHAFLAACRLDGFDAAVDLWGGNVVMSAGPADRKAAGGADRLHEGPVVPAARTVRRGRRQPVAGAGRGPRAGAAGPRQGLRVPHVRGRRARLLLLPPADVPPGAGRRRVGQGLRLLRKHLGA